MLSKANQSAIKFDLARIRNDESGKDSQQCGFSTTRRTNQNQAVDVIDLERHTIESEVFTEGLG